MIVEQCGATMEQWNSDGGKMWWNSGTVWWNSEVEQWNSVGGTAMVEQ